MISLLEWRIMFIGLGGLGGLVLLELLTRSLVTRILSMLQISSKSWKGQTSGSLQRFVIWLLVVVGVWAGLDVGVLLLVDVMGGVVDVVILVMGDEMGEEAVVGECLIPLPAGQKKEVAVDMSTCPETDMVGTVIAMIEVVVIVGALIGMTGFHQHVNGLQCRVFTRQ